MTEKYYPEPVPYTDDLPYIREFLFREFLRISASFEGVREIELEELSLEPTARAGMIKFADGVNWDPGGGKGFYGYNGTGWVKLDELENSQGQQFGSWTPTLNFGGATTGITYSATRTGSWTKLGRLVVFQGRFILTSKGTATGNVSITGLPYATESGNRYAPITIPYAAQFTGLTGALTGYIENNSSAITLRQTSATGTAAILTDTVFTNTTDIIVGGAYQTAG